MSAAMGTIDYGVINWFNNEFGFGFITPDSDGVDVFVHISQIGTVTLVSVGALEGSVG